MFRSPSLRAIAAASDSHASSTTGASSYSPFASPPPSLYRHDFSPHSSPAFASTATMPFTPPSSHPESFDSSVVPSSSSSKDVVVAAAPTRYVRGPYTIQPQAPHVAPVNNVNGVAVDSVCIQCENIATPTLATGAAAAADEISTLFVFGFPDDMMEREFQNLFLFAPGFEAATLKVPVPTSSSGGDQFGSSGGEDSSSVVVGGGHRGSIDDEYDSRTTTTTSNGGVSPTKRQKIGFAKFVTRQDAVDALDVLNRKKVDLERGLTLRAEMAKKNLHVKKSNAGFVGGAPGSYGAPFTTTAAAAGGGGGGGADHVVSSASSVSSLSNGSALAALTTTNGTPSSNGALDSAVLHGTGPSIPLSALDPETLKRLANSGNVNPAVLAEIARQRATSSVSTSSTSTSTTTTSTPALTAFEAFHSVPAPPGPPVNASQTLDSQGYFDANNPHDGHHVSPYLARDPSSHSLTRQSSLLGNGSVRSSSLAGPGGGENGFTPSSTTTTQHQVPFPLQQQQPPSHQAVVHPRHHSLPYGGPGGGYGSQQLVPAVVRPQTHAQQQVGAHIAQQQAQLAAQQAYARSLNPADMNAPKKSVCDSAGFLYFPRSLGSTQKQTLIFFVARPNSDSTLYVGGLPAILPSLTGPFSASHLEDSAFSDLLRQLSRSITS